jgi:hypothetical protein
MGNYAQVSKIPTKQLNNFLKKIGYELVIDMNSHNRFVALPDFAG